MIRISSTSTKIKGERHAKIRGLGQHHPWCCGDPARHFWVSRRRRALLGRPRPRPRCHALTTPVATPTPTRTASSRMSRPSKPAIARTTLPTCASAMPILTTPSAFLIVTATPTDRKHARCTIWVMPRMCGRRLSVKIGDGQPSVTSNSIVLGVEKLGSYLCSEADDR